MSQDLAPKTCFYAKDGMVCSEQADYVVIGETLSCWFDVRKPKDEGKAEFCLEHANIVKQQRQTQTPVR